MDADLTDAGITRQIFSRQGQSDWMASLKRLSRAQAILWDETPIKERQELLARVDAEQQRHVMKGGA